MYSRKLMNVLVLLISAVCFCGFAGAANYYTGADDGDWTLDSNWSAGSAPVSGEEAKMGKPAIVSGDAICGDLVTAYIGSGVNMSGGTLTVTGSMWLGAAGTNSYFNVSDGTVNPLDLTSSSMQIHLLGSDFAINGPGAVVNAYSIGYHPSYTSDGGVINLDAGLLNIGNWNGTVNTLLLDSNVTMNITGGTLKIRDANGDIATALESYVTAGYLSGYGYGDMLHVVISFNSAEKVTYVTAVESPEFHWNGSVDSSWDDSANWTTDVPTVLNGAKIWATAVSPVISTGIDAVCNKLTTVGDGAVIDVTGGTLTVGAEGMWLGNNSGICQFNVSGEAEVNPLDVTSSSMLIYLLNSDLTIEDTAVVNAYGVGAHSSYTIGGGDIFLDGGLLNIGNWNGTLNTLFLNDKVGMDITEGKLQIRDAVGTVAASLEEHVANGYLTGYGYADLAHLSIVFDDVNDVTVVTANPDGATEAITQYWSYGDIDNSWGRSDNWVSAYPPTLLDTVYLYGAGDGVAWTEEPELKDGTDALAAYLKLKSYTDGYNSRMKMSGGSLAVDMEFYIGESDKGGEFLMTGGQVTKGNIYVANGSFTMQDQAVVDIYGIGYCDKYAINNVAQVHLDGGTMTIGSYNWDVFTLRLSEDCRMNITEGVLKIKDVNDDFADDVQAYVDAGYLTGYASHIGPIDPNEVDPNTIEQGAVLITREDNYTVVTAYDYLCTEDIAGDANNDCKVDTEDLLVIAENWLNSMPAFIYIEDFESYADQAALEVKWSTQVLAEGTAGLSFVSGNSMKLDYGVVLAGGAGWGASEAILALDNPVDVSDYGQLKLDLNRYAGNITADKLYVKLYDQQIDDDHIIAVAFIDNGMVSPTGWTTETLNIPGDFDFSIGGVSGNYASFAGTQVVGVMIGMAHGDDTSGSIEVDNILLDGSTLKGDIAGNDGEVDFEDFATVASDWLECNRDPSSKCW